jgi:hypothetical protein
MTDLARPKRKAIPVMVKLESVLLHDSTCPHCQKKLGDLKGLNFDHRPALINRPVSDDGTDYVPPQLDPEFIEPMHIDCHKVRTFGPGGQKRVTTAGSDLHTRDKVVRLSDEAEEFRKALLSKAQPKKPGAGQNRTPGGLPRNKPQRSATTRPSKLKIAYRPRP